MSNTKSIPAIPEPHESGASQYNTIMALKEATEVMAGQRGPSPFPTWDDLVRLGLISRQDIPRR